MERAGWGTSRERRGARESERRQERPEREPRAPSAVSLAILREISANWEPDRAPPPRTGL